MLASANHWKFFVVNEAEKCCIFITLESQHWRHQRRPDMPNSQWNPDTQT